MTTILKKLRNLPMLGLVAAAAVLSVVLGCGGSESGNSAPNNAVAIDLAGTLGEDDSVATVGFNIINNSSASISSVTYFNADGAEVLKPFEPMVSPRQTIAVIARVKVSKITNSTGGSGTTTSTTTYTSTTNAITVIISATNGSNRTYTLGVSVDPSTGEVKLSPGSADIQFVG